MLPRSIPAQQRWPECLVVHRLDMATSGLVLMARSPAMQRALGLAFERRRVHKRYEAVVCGQPVASAQTDGWAEIDLPLIVDWLNRPRSKVDHAIGKPIHHLALDFLDREFAVRGAQDVGKAVLRQFQRDLAAHEGGEGKQAGERAFKDANIRGDAMGEEFKHAVREDEALVLRAVEFNLLLQDAEAEFVIGRVKVHDKAALQAGLDAFFKILDFARRAVGRDDDLLVLVHQRVEGVEEFFLRGVLARDELHVIDHQDIDRAEDFLEVHDLAFAKRLHEAVHELFGRQV